MKTANLAMPSAWPARLDFLQSVSGLFLALFMWLHMAFVSSILLGKDVFWGVSRFFEGYFIFGKPLPWLVSLFVALVFTIIVLHAALAMRKFPANWRQYRAFWTHMRGMRHQDTNLWLVQVITGFAMFFLASIHLYTMMSEPELIGPYGSADLVWSGRTWPMLALLLFCVEVHGTLGLYRLALKWGWPAGDDPDNLRRKLKRVMWGLIIFLLLLGLLTLAAYIKIGIEHASQAGELYTPVWVQERP